MNIKHLKEPYVLVLIGPPLSGKDFFIRQNFSDKDVVMISRDQILLDVYGSDNYDEAFKNVDQKKVDVELANQLRQASVDKKNVIINMTNMTSKRRSHNLSYFSDDYLKVAVIFPILEWDEYRRRNLKRQQEEKKSIPEQVIKNMISSYQPINPSEGFDKIFSL